MITCHVCVAVLSNIAFQYYTWTDADKRRSTHSRIHTGSLFSSYSRDDRRIRTYTQQICQKSSSVYIFIRCFFPLCVKQRRRNINTNMHSKWKYVKLFHFLYFFNSTPISFALHQRSVAGFCLVSFYKNIVNFRSRFFFHFVSMLN